MLFFVLEFWFGLGLVEWNKKLDFVFWVVIFLNGNIIGIGFGMILLIWRNIVYVFKIEMLSV